MLRQISNFWLLHIHPRLTSLIATIGIIGLASCLLILFVLAKLAEEVLEGDTFAFDTCLGGLILNTGLKLFFSKPRPELWHRLISEKSFSFPSGHALGSMVLYGFIAYELATHYPHLAKVIYSLTVILIAAIGISRLYLGVHWPTDIIAGYGVGFLWLMICITMLKLQRLE